METIEKEMNGQLSTEYTYPMRVTTIAMVAFIAILAWLIAPPEFTMYAAWAITAGGLAYLAFEFVKAHYVLLLKILGLPIFLGLLAEEVIIYVTSRVVGFVWCIVITVIALYVISFHISDPTSWPTWGFIALAVAFIIGCWSWFEVNF